MKFVLDGQEKAADGSLGEGSERRRQDDSVFKKSGRVHTAGVLAITAVFTKKGEGQKKFCDCVGRRRGEPIQSVSPRAEMRGKEKEFCEGTHHRAGKVTSFDSKKINRERPGRHLLIGKE